MTDANNAAISSKDREEIASMPLADRIRLLSGKGSWWIHPIGPLGLESAQVADGPHGVRRQSDEADESGAHPTELATCFPPAATLASTWDIELAARVGEALGTEAASVGLSTLLGPGLNIKRHPGGGRNFEYFSEDPFLSGHMAAAMVRGIQSKGVAACLKHFAANNHESFRNVANAVVDERTLREIYLRGFEIAVRESDPWTVMCSYNLVNEVYCSEDRWLLTDVLRTEWGFDGLVMSDWGATNDRPKGIHAGLDLQMPGCDGAFDQQVLEAVADGRLAEDDINLGVGRVAQLVRRTARSAEGRDSADHDANHELARRVAAAGTVLLANDGVLPLASSANVALLGAFAKQPRFQGAGSSQVNPTRLTNLHDELTELASVDYLPVYDPLTGDAPRGVIAEAAKAAGNADVAIVAIGLPDTYESEGFDRLDLRGPAVMADLIEQTCAAQPNTVVVLFNGAPMEMPWSDQPAAIVEAYLGGQAGGAGLADVLLGRRDPGGRLAESIPMNAADLPSARNFPGLPRQTEYREGHHVGYRFHATANIAPRFAFGHGLSYTTFDVAAGSVSHTPDATLLPVTVVNAGERAGSHVVQVYVEPVASTFDRPVRQLAGFAKVHLDSGDNTVVDIKLDDRAFQVYDVGQQCWITLAGAYDLCVARSSREITERVRVEVESGDVPSATPGTKCPWIDDDAGFSQALGRPIPSPPPVRPFHRNSTGVDVSETAIGRNLLRAMKKAGGSAVKKEMPEITEEMLAVYLNTAGELPLRTAVAMGNGRVRFAHIDALISVLNGEWWAVIRRATAGVAGRLRRLARRS